MKERRLYICEFCYTQYYDKEEAEKCELSHSKVIEVTRQGCYHPVKSFPEYMGYPDRIEVKMSNGKLVEYRLTK